MSNDKSTLKFCEKCHTDTERYADQKCKMCVRARQKSYLAANADKERARQQAYRATNTDKVKARKAAYYAVNKVRAKALSTAWKVANPERDKATRAAWNNANPGRGKARGAAYREAHLEQIKKKDASWAKANPELIRIKSQNRRARKLDNGGVLSKGLSAKLFKLQQGKCPCCKQPLGDNYHLDHIKPMALGGSNTDDNMQLLRQRCNLQKHTKHPVEFMQSRGFLL